MQIDDLDRKWTELFCQIGKTHGWDTLTSTVVASIYIEPEEIAMDDIAKQTGYSLASISGKIRTLEDMGFIHKVTRPGTKKVYVSMEKDLVKLFRNGILKSASNKISLVKHHLPLVLKEKGDRRKREILEKYYNSVLKFESVLNEIVKKIEAL